MTDDDATDIELLAPDAGAEIVADEPDPAFGETDDESGETPIADEPSVEDAG